MERVCFLLRLKKDRIADYLGAHENVWPEVLAALKESGWHDYSLFLRESNGLVVGYLETEDFDQAMARMEATDVNERWQALMGGCFDELDGAHPNQGLERLVEYFHN